MLKPWFRVRTCVTIIALLSVAFVVFFPSQQTTAAQGINRQLNYQAKLLTSGSVPVTSGAYSIKFSIYSAASGGTPLWTAAGTVGAPTAIPVTVTGGLFTIQFGDTSSGQNPLDIDWFQDSLYLGVTVGSDSEMTPRKRLTAVPYAFVAETLQGQYASSSVTSAGGELFNLRQQSADSALAARTALYISTSGTSNVNDYLLKASNGAEVFTVSRQGHTTTTGNFATGGSVSLGDSSSDFVLFNAQVASSIIPNSNGAFDLGSASQSWANIYASGTVVVGTDVKVGGSSVCLVNGTNCPTGASRDLNWTYDGALDLVTYTTATTDLVIGGSATTTAPVFFSLSGEAASSNRLILGQNQNLNVLIGGTTSTALNSAFQLSGDDLFVQGNIGSATSVYSNGAFIAGSGTTYFGDGFVNRTNGALNIQAGGATILSVNANSVTSTGFLVVQSTGTSTFNGVVSSTRVLVNAGTAAAPGISIDNMGGSGGQNGFYTYIGNQIGVAINGNGPYVIFTGSSLGTSFNNAITPLANNGSDVGLANWSWRNIYASGTAFIATDVKVGGSSVCLVNGTNCPTGASRDLNWTYDGALDLVTYTTATTDLVIGGSATTTAPVFFSLSGEAASSNRLILGQNQNLNVLIGGTTSTALNSAFQLSGDDLFVQGSIGSATSVYTNGAFVAGSGTTYFGDGFVNRTNGALNIQAGGATILSINANSVTSSADIVPSTTNLYSLGSAALAWQNIYASGTLTIGRGVTSTGNISPSANNAYNLGTAALSWANIYSSGTIFGVSQTLTGTSTAGPFSFTPDAGAVTAMDYTCTSASPSEQPCSYDFDINGQTFLSVYSRADGAGGLQTTSTALRIFQPLWASPNNTIDIGANGTNAFRDIYASGTLTVGAVTTSGPIGPSLNNSYDVGSPALSWASVYASGTVFAGTDVKVGGTSVCLSTGVNCPSNVSSTDLNWAYNGATDLMTESTATTDIVIGGSATTTAPVFFSLSGEAASSNRLILGQNQNMDVVIGGTTSTALNSAFQLSGDDLFVQGNIGSATSVYSNGAFIAGSGTTLYGDGFVNKTNGALNIQDIGNTILSINANSVTSTVNIVPSGSITLGASGAQWARLYAVDAFINSQSVLSGVAVTGASTTRALTSAFATGNGDQAFKAAEFVFTNSVFSAASNLSLIQSSTGTLKITNGGTGGGRGNLEVGSVTSAGSLYPATSNTYDLGSANNAWANIYASGSLAVGQSISNGLSSGSIFTTTTSGYDVASGGDEFDAMWIDGSTIYVGDVANDGRFGVIDVTDPYHVTSTFYDCIPSDCSLGSGSDTVVSGRYAYVVGSGSLRVIDISDKSLPLLVSSTTISGLATYVVINGNRLYIAGATTISIFDISSPVTPRALSTYDTGTAVNAMKAAGPYLYYTLYTPVGGKDFFILDVSSSTNPALVGSTVSRGALGAGQSIGLQVRNNRAYVVGSGTSTLSILNIANPRSPTTTGVFSFSSSANLRNDLEVVGDDVFVASAASSTIEIINVASSTQPYRVTAINVPLLVSGVTAFKVFGGYIYAFDSDTLYVYKIPGVTTAAIDALTGYFGSSFVQGDAIVGGNVFANNSVNVGPGGIITNGTIGVSGSGTSTFVGTILSAAIQPSLNNVYDLGAASGSWQNIYASGTLVIGRGVTSTGNVSPSADSAYSLGTPTLRWQGLNAVNATTTNFFTTNLTVGGSISVSTTAPTVLRSIKNAERIGIPTGNVAVSGRMAYLPNTNQLTMIDIGDPSSATTVSKFSETGIKNIAVAGQYAYITGGSSFGLRIVDISNPALPVNLGTAGSAVGTDGVAVSGRFAYATADTATQFWVVDVSSSTKPVLQFALTSSTAFFQANGVVVQNGYAYVAANNQVSVMDVMTPAATTTFAGWVRDTTNLASAGYPAVRGAYLYVPASNRLNIIDITAATSPRIVGTLVDATNLAGAHSVSLAGSVAYVTGNTNHKVVAVDISNPTTPVELGVLTDTTNLDTPKGIVISGRNAYVVAGSNATNSALTILNISGYQMDAANVGALSAGSAYVGESLDVGGQLSVRGGVQINGGGLTLDGSLAVQGDATSSIYGKVDLYGGLQVSRGDLTVFPASGFTSEYVTSTGGVSYGDMAVRDNYLFVADSFLSRFVVMDLSNPTSVRTVVALTSSTGALSGAVGMAISGNYAFTLAPSNAANNDRLTVIDISNPLAPTFATSVQIANAPAHIKIQGKYAYIIHVGSATSVSIVDISSSTQPAVVRTIADQNNIDTSLNALAVSGNRLYLSGSNGKFTVVDITNPLTATATASVATSAGLSNGLAARGRYVYRSISGSLQAVDVSSTAGTPTVSTCVTAGTLGALAASGRYIYTIGSGGAVSAYNVDNTPTGCTLAAARTGTGAAAVDIVLRGNQLITSDVNRLRIHVLPGLDVATANIGSIYGSNITLTDYLSVQGNILSNGGVQALGDFVTQGAVVSWGSTTSTFAGVLSSMTAINAGSPTSSALGSLLTSRGLTSANDGTFTLMASSSCGTCDNQLILTTNLYGISIDPGVTAGSNLTLGGTAGAQDSVIFGANIASDIMPRADAAYSFGSTTLRFNAYLNNVTGTYFAASSTINPTFYSDGGITRDNIFTITATGTCGACNDTLGYLRLFTNSGSIKLDPNVNGAGIVRLGTAGDSDIVLSAGNIRPTTDDTLSIGTSSTDRWRAFLSSATATVLEVDDTLAASRTRFMASFVRPVFENLAEDGLIAMIATSTNSELTASDIPLNSQLPLNASGLPYQTAGLFINKVSQGTIGEGGFALVAVDYTSSSNAAGATRGGALIAARRCGTAANTDIVVFGTDTDPRRMSFRCNGQLFLDNTTIGSGGDYAELFPAPLDLVGGEVVAMTSDTASSVRRAMAADRDRVLGVISDQPVVLGNAGKDQKNAEDPNYKAVGLIGQLAVKASAANGPILAGDKVMAGDSGFAVKASGVGIILGQAMENLVTTTGSIMVYVDPTWSADGVLEAATGTTIVRSLGEATSSTIAFDSQGISFQGSAWDVASSTTVTSQFTIFNDVITASSSLLTVRDKNNTNLLTISDVGDISVRGDLTVGRRLYLGSKTSGVGSTSTYIYVDDTLAPSSTYIATNADGWSTSSTYDYAERFHSDDTLGPGDLVAADPGGIDRVKRSTSKDDVILGIVSTKPGFVTGAHSTGTYPIALAGRVPTRVSTANGAIVAGDQLAPSDVPGVAMKAVSSGPTVGIALEGYDAPTEGKISVFVQPGWKGGEIVTNGSAPASVTYQAAASVGVSARSGLAKIVAGSTEVNVAFPTLSSYPLVTVTPYGQPTKGWWLTNVNDHGFTLVLGEAPMFDLTFAWKAEPSQDGNTISFSDGTAAPYDPTSGQVVSSPTPALTVPTSTAAPSTTPAGSSTSTADAFSSSTASTGSGATFTAP